MRTKINGRKKANIISVVSLFSLAAVRVFLLHHHHHHHHHPFRLSYVQGDMAAGGNDVIDSSTDDATGNRKQTAAAGESRGRDTSPAVNDVLKDAGEDKSLDRRSSQRGSVLDTNNTNSTTTDTEHHHTRSLSSVVRFNDRFKIKDLLGH